MIKHLDMTCPFCKIHPDKVMATEFDDLFTVNCKRCGLFSISGSAYAVANAQQKNPKISAWIRERTEYKLDPPKIDSNNLRELELSIPNYSVGEKFQKLLRALEIRTTFPGEPVLLDIDLDYPLGWALQDREFTYLLRGLVERGYIKQSNANETLESPSFKVFITSDGWTYLADNSRKPATSNQVFVAMAFSEELTPAWINGIRPALERAGFKPYRIDAVPHIDRIDAKIISEIKNSRFVVADVTLQRPGVYFEAGFAIGIGIPVFWCVRNDDLMNVHFDTRQYNHIVWENPTQLSETLYDYVMAIVGQGGSQRVPVPGN